jgi:hypothetical protein
MTRWWPSGCPAFWMVQPVPSCSAPSAASRAQLIAPARVCRSVVMQGQAAGAGPAPAPAPAGKVGDLPFHDGTDGFVAFLLGRVALLSTGPLQNVLTRVDRDGPPARRLLCAAGLTDEGAAALDALD